MIWLWSLSIAGFLTALVALMIARRTARQLADVTHMYWQLKFDQGELKARVDPQAPRGAAPQETFVPLSSIKKS